MTETITIAGHSFQAPVKYKEGDELNANEAAALNQTYHENLRNNFAKKVKDAGESPDLAALQSEFDAYASAYEFGVRTGGGGGGPRDPVQTEAMAIARAMIKTALKKKGKKAEASAINEAAKQLIASETHGPGILETAKQRVAETQAAAQGDLSDIIASLPEKAPAAEPAAQPAQ